MPIQRLVNYKSTSIWEGISLKVIPQSPKQKRLSIRGAASFINERISRPEFTEKGFNETAFKSNGGKENAHEWFRLKHNNTKRLINKCSTRFRVRKQPAKEISGNKIFL